MKKYLDIIKTVSLFKGVNEEELQSMLECLGAEIKTVSKNNIILLTGEKPLHIGIVLSGMLHIVKEDYDGNRTLITAAPPGEIYAEALCCANVEESPVTVIACEDTTIMLLRFDRILHTCPNSCIFHQKLIENMLNLLANKNLYLQNRMEIISIKSIRVKVLRYLESFASKQGRNITIHATARCVLRRDNRRVLRG